MSEAGKIISLARKEMREMLGSVYEYNRSFLLDKGQEKLLERILFAMTIIDRKFFAGENCYFDNALPIGLGQTISQPSTVARMLLLAGLKEGDDVLEVGTGSGWNASLIAFLVYPGKVVSIERLAKLKEKAEENLSALRNYLQEKKPQNFVKLEKINFLAKNVFSLQEKNKFDRIIITAGIKKGEEEKIKNLAGKLLKEEGILICPYVSGPLLIYNKQGEKFLTKEQYVFVPLLE